MTRQPQVKTNSQLQTILSGGQTGADRAALDAGLAVGVTIGGACPKGRLAEDGPADPKYPLEEVTGGYRQGTRSNVTASDGTVIFYRVKSEGGTETTLVFCIKLNKPYTLIDIDEITVERAARKVREFVNAFEISTLNVAGPRETCSLGMSQFVYSITLMS